MAFDAEALLVIFDAGAFNAGEFDAHQSCMANDAGICDAFQLLQFGKLLSM